MDVFLELSVKEGLKKYSADNHTLTFLTQFKNLLLGQKTL